MLLRVILLRYPHYKLCLPPFIQLLIGWFGDTGLGLLSNFVSLQGQDVTRDRRLDGLSGRRSGVLFVPSEAEVGTTGSSLLSQEVSHIFVFEFSGIWAIEWKIRAGSLLPFRLYLLGFPNSAVLKFRARMRVRWVRHSLGRIPKNSVMGREKMA